MTTIAAVVKDGYVSIAAESQTSFGWSKITTDFLHNETKLHQWGKNIFGLTGSMSMSMVMMDLINSSKRAPTLNSPSAIFNFMRQLHPQLKKKYFIQAKDEDDDPVETSRLTMLIANPYGLFGVDPMREVSHYNQFWAIGSGSRFALGAMYAQYNNPKMDAKAIAALGVKAGTVFDVYSGGEIKVKTVKLK